MSDEDDAPFEVSLPSARTQAKAQEQRESLVSKAVVGKRKIQAREKEAWFREQKTEKKNKLMELVVPADSAASKTAPKTAKLLVQSGDDDEDFGSDISEPNVSYLQSSEGGGLLNLADITAETPKGGKRNKNPNGDFPDFIPLQNTVENVKIVPVSGLRTKLTARESALDHLKTRYKPSVFQKRIPASKVQSIMVKQRERRPVK